MGRLALVSVLAAVLAVLALASGAEAISLGSVTSLAPPPKAVSGAETATLSDGRVLTVGGSGPADQYADATLFDRSHGTWSPVAGTPVTSGQGAAAPLPDDRALVLGEVATSAKIYNGSTNTWTAAASMPYVLTYPVAAALPGGRVLVVATAPSIGPSVAEIYDSGTNTWSSTTHLPIRADASSAAAALPDGRVLVLAAGGGHTIRDLQSLAYVYDAATATWQRVPAPPVFAEAAAALPDGRVAAAGASLDGRSTGASLVVLDPVTGRWSELPGPFSADSPLVAPLPDGDVLVAGGGNLGAHTPLSAAYTVSLAPRASAQSLLAPAVTGAPALGQTLTASFEGGGPFMSYTVQWQRCTSTCVDLSPTSAADPSVVASDTSYAVTAADLGARLRFVVTATGEGQTLSATSAPSTPVTYPGYHFAAGLGQPVAMLRGPNSGNAVIGVQRDHATDPGLVRYTVTFGQVGATALYPPISGTLYFAAGQSRASIVVSVEDAGTPILADIVNASLSAPSDLRVVAPSQVSLPLWRVNPASYIRNPANPLGLSTAPPAGEPLAGVSFFSDPNSIAARVAYLWRDTSPVNAGLLQEIAHQPSTARFGAWNGEHPGLAVASFLARAARQAPGTVPMLSTYRIVNGQCHRGADTAAEADAYHNWIQSLTEGIGTHPAVLFLEMDSLITTPCLRGARLATRLQELRDAVRLLADAPHLVVYLDAGAADALSARRVASLLRAAGVAGSEGFFLNSTHFDWTNKEIAYGERISRLIGGKHFVINTAENGRGPLVPHDRAVHGNEVLCNPPGRGLGPVPTWNTHHPDVDAFAWIANPGVSGGTCRPGAPQTGKFWPAEAISLARHANFAVQ